MTEAVRFEVLGPVRLRGVDGMVEPAGRLQRILLAVLLANANEPVSVDVLTDALWGGEHVPRSAQKLQVHVHKLRRALDDPGRLSFGPSGYRLLTRPGEVDVERFTTLVDAAARFAASDPARCADLLREALSHFRGTPYVGLDVRLLVAEADRLGERRLTALEQRFEAELARGEHAAAVPELATLVAAHPLRERLAGLLMTALHRAGRQAEALEVYRGTRRRLVDELGLEPGPALRAIEQQVSFSESDTPAAEPVRPAQLPHNARGFVGREAELSELDGVLDAAQETPATAVVVGTAGAGKTALAVRWAHRARDRFPDGQLYVDLRGYGPEDPVSPGDALDGFLRALGVEGAAVPQNLDERSARFRSLVDGKHMLVLLDNARTVDQVRPLLAGTPTVVVVVTSRDMLAGLVARDGAERVVVERLPLTESVTLLRMLTGGRLDNADSEATALAEQCARLPLALRIAAELVRARPASTVGDLIHELTGEHRRLELFGADGDPHTAVRAAFSWSYQHLPPPAARLFRLLGLHPGQDIDRTAMAALAGLPMPDTTRALTKLIRAHLVDEVRHGRYQLHDLLRAYAAELVAADHAGQADTDPPADRDAALTRLFDHYLDTAAAAQDIFAPYDGVITPPTGEVSPTPALSSRADALRWFDAERGNLLRAASFAAERGWSRYPAQLSVLLWRYLDLGGHFDEAVTLHTQARAAARTLHDKVAEGNALRVLALTNRHFGRIDTAMRLTEEALELYRAAGHPVLEATALSNLSAVGMFYGRVHEAIERLLDAVRLYVENGRPALTATPLRNLGNLFIRIGDYDRAAEYLDQAIAISTESNFLPMLSSSWCELAAVQARTGRARQAVATAWDALALAREIGDRFREANGLCRLATAHRMLGERGTALRHHLEAVRLARAVGASLLLMEVLMEMGESQLAFGMPADAIEAFSEAAELAADGVVPDRGRAHAGLGDAYEALARHDQAREQWRIALEFLDGTDLPDADRVRANLPD